MIYILQLTKVDMKYVIQSDDNELSSIAVVKRTKRKLGMLISKNQSFDKGLEELADRLLADKK